MGWIVVPVLTVLFFLWERHQQRRGLQRAARNILECNQRLYAAEHELRIVDDHSEEMREALDEAAREFDRAGLIAVCDVENMAVNATTGTRLPIRYFVGRDEEVAGGAYVATGFRRVVVEVGCLLSDGRSLTTSTAEEIASLARPPWSIQQFLDVDASLEELLDRHRALLDRLRAEDPGLRPVVARTPQLLLEHWRQLQRRKHEFRRALGWVTLEELQALAEGDTRKAAAVYREIRRILEASP